MDLPAHQSLFDADAYLAWEAEQPTKHEYLAGEVFAMAGAPDAHVTIAGNVYMALRNHLRVEEDNAFFYPDVFVTCSDADRQQRNAKSEPTLIVEVLSPATSAYDRGAKFAAYRKLASLREYLLIDPERLAADLFRRDGDSPRWVLHPFEAGDTVECASVGLTLPIEALYADALPAEGAAIHPSDAPRPESGPG
ncbi:Uma2 family endonuclease [Comamonas faecalis]|uniref:Uma2 family endonuclease n=1 Tax=Comamonas faecalis TaxID=1387849 RepID=A0ABP7R1F6_9BURK